MWYFLAFQITEFGVQVAGGGERLCGGQVALHPAGLSGQALYSVRAAWPGLGAELTCS